MSSAAATHAQTEPVKFGQIDAKDLTAAPFAADSATGAVVLCDYGRSRLVGYRLVPERRDEKLVIKKEC